VISTIIICSTDAQHSSVQQWEGPGTHSLYQLVSCWGASDEREQTGSASYYTHHLGESLASPVAKQSPASLVMKHKLFYEMKNNSIKFKSKTTV
jgi:hypothetical protein